MAKLGDVTRANVPGVGKVSLLNPISLIQLFFGGVLILVLWPIAQRVASGINSKLPQKAVVTGADSPGYVILGQ